MTTPKTLSTSITAPRRKLTISSHVVPQLIVTLDSVVIMATAVVAYIVFEGSAYVERTDYYVSAVLFVWLTGLLLMHFAGLYKFEPILRPLAFAEKILVALGTTFLFLFAAAFSLKISAVYSRVWVGAFAIAVCTGVLVARAIAARVLRVLADRRMFARNVVICGHGEQATHLLTNIESMRPQFISVMGLFTDNSSAANSKSCQCPILGRVNDVAAYVRANEVDDVVIALPWSADEQITAIVAKLRELPVNVYLGADLIGFRLALRQPPDHFGKLPIVEIMGRPLSGWGAAFKTIEDYVLGSVLAVLSAPFMLLIAIAIKLDSRGPVFFRQERYGFVNKRFYIYKFRTMEPSTESPGKTLQATSNDPRVTRVGRYLRRWSLDEIPQIFNVMNGTMSLVGPRPHAIDHNEEYAEKIRGYFARHRVKPGITGWAQVNGLRGPTETVEKMERRVDFDIYYVENWSLLFDVKILAMTGLACLTGRNAH